MPKFPKPFFRSSRNCWYVQIGKEQIKLSSDKDEAMKLYHKLMVERDQASPTPKRPTQSTLLASVMDMFLSWVQIHRSTSTYEWYQKHLQGFLDFLTNPSEVIVADLRPYHVQQWVDNHPNWGPSYRRGAMIAIQRTLSWAAKLGHIDRSPIAGLEKPAQTRRELVIPLEHYRTMLQHIRERTQWILTFAWETGARPEEIRKIEARHFVSARERIEIPPQESKGKKRWRIIYLNATALAIVQRLSTAHPMGPIFLNEDSQPWTPFALNCVFTRLKRYLHIKYSMYSFRHTFCQRMLESGLDTVTVAALMGHANAVMVASVYSHMGNATDFLKEQLNQVSSNSDAST